MGRKFRYQALALALLVTLNVKAAELPFAVEQVRQYLLPREQAFHAVLKAVNQSTVAAQATARVMELLFDVNDFVPKGAVLLRIDQATPRAQLDAAEAELQEAQARASEAQKEFSRIEEIYERKLVSRAQLDRASANLKAARARLEAARARVTQAKETVAFMEVRAPYSGIVTKRHVELGETVTPGQALMTGFSLEKMRAAASVPQAIFDKIRSQGRARIVFTAMDGREIEARQLTFFPFADPGSHTFTVRAELPEGEAGIYHGMFAKVLFQVGEERRLLVPTQAIVPRSEVTAVYVMNGKGRVALRQVRVGRMRDNGKVEVLAGLDEGGRVALDPILAGVHLKEQGPSGARS